MLLALIAVVAASRQDCVDNCKVTGACDGGCSDVWENCCNVWGCEWMKKCTPKTYITQQFQGGCGFLGNKVQVSESGKVWCSGNNWELDNALESQSDNDVQCIEHNWRYKYNAATKKAQPFPPVICKDLEAKQNTGGMEVTSIWETCSTMNCFDVKMWSKDGHTDCKELCSSFKRRGLHDETDKCCVTVPSENPELEPEYSECVQDPLQMGVKCALRGCGAEWYCSEDAKSRGASCDCSIWRGNSCPIGRRWRKCIRLCGSC